MMKIIITSLFFFASVQVNSATVIFENNFSQWLNSTGDILDTIDFDSISAPSPIEIIGNEFSSSTLSPVFSLIEGGSMLVGNPATNQTLTPTSGENMFFPECNPSCEGIIRVSFDQSITSFGTFFIDVEADFTTTGYSLTSGNLTPEIAFSSFQGQNAQSFLGFISDIPFNSLDIHFTTGSNIDGTLIDDIYYGNVSAIPIPAAGWLFISGLLALYWTKKKS